MSRHEVDESRRKFLAALAATPALIAGCSAEEDRSGEVVTTEWSALTETDLQSRCTAFYAMRNEVEIRIEMPQGEWNNLCAEQPTGGKCSFNFPPESDRFVWRKATKVTIKGTTAVTTARSFNNVGIKKKSHCASFSTERPSFKLDFKEYDNNEVAVEDAIGTTHLTLNNCLEDPSFIRQPLAYALFGDAGLPASRCNFCKVFVNGVVVGVFVNVEPIRKRFLKNPRNGFTNTTGGNLYEFELNDDFVASRIQYIDVESLSAQTNKADLSAAATEMLDFGLEGVKRFVDVDQYIKFHAMEFLLKHVDSYSGGQVPDPGRPYQRGNNTYVYNDVQAVQNPKVNLGQVKFKFIPYGADYILQPSSQFGVVNESLSGNVGSFMREDPTLRQRIADQIRIFGESVFARDIIEGPIRQFIDLMQSILVRLGAKPIGGTTNDMLADIAVVRKELVLVRSAAFVMGGLPTTSVFIMDPATNDIMRASSSLKLVDTPTLTTWEVLHRSPVGVANDRWLAAGQGFKNEGNSGWLHCSNTMRTPAGHLRVYTSSQPDDSGSQRIIIAPEITGAFAVSGKFKLRNNRNGLYLKFGTDDLAGGTSPAQRVYQSGEAEATPLIFY